LASDLSNIIKEELSNTLEQLLSKTFTINGTNEASASNISSTQSIEVAIKFSFKDTISNWKFYIPTSSATKFEYLMLGGMGDLKEHIDDEIADAINEIISNVCGSISTSVNAQGFDDIGSIKSEVLKSSIIENSTLPFGENTFDFDISMDDEKVSILINFDDIILPFISEITGKEVEKTAETVSPEAPIPTASEAPSALSSEVSSVSALLNDTSAKNLKLLFDIKLRLSVRLGRKIFLLKDILRWDIGEIIELEQMVNEPLEILVNGIKIGEGEAVIVEGKFGLKIKNIGNEMTRLSQIGLG